MERPGTRTPPTAKTSRAQQPKTDPVWRQKGEDVEAAVLGGVIGSGPMLAATMMEAVLDHIASPEDFYSSANQAVFRAMLALHESGASLDIISITHELRRTGVLDDGPRLPGGDSLVVYLSELSGMQRTESGLRSMAAVVAERAVLRGIHEAGVSMATMAAQPTADALALLREADADLATLGDRTGVRRIRNIVDGRAKWQADLDARLAGEAPGIASPWRSLNDQIGGFMAGQKIVLGADSNTGKTQLALQIALHASATHGPVVYISTEMKLHELYGRAVAIESKVPAGRIMFEPGTMLSSEQDRVREATKRVDSLPLRCYEARGMTAQECGAVIRRAVRQWGARMAIVDNLQNLLGDKARVGIEGVTAEASDIHKTLAGDLNIPVIELSQLTLEKPGQRPTRYSLRGSRMVFNDADTVLLLYRPEVYDIAFDEVHNLPTRGLAEIAIAKSRVAPPNKRLVFTWDEKLIQFYEGAPHEHFDTEAVQPTIFGDSPF